VLYQSWTQVHFCDPIQFNRWTGLILVYQWCTQDFTMEAVHVVGDKFLQKTKQNVKPVYNF